MFDRISTWARPSGALAVLFLVSAFGCSDGDDEVPPAPQEPPAPELPQDSYCWALADAECRWARECCELGELQSILGLDPTDPYSVEVTREAMASQESCEELVHSGCVRQNRALLESIRDARVTLSDEAFDECVAAHDAAAVTCDVGALTGASVAEACATTALFAGNVAEGGACFHPLDCAAGTYCWQPLGSTDAGICRATVDSGDTCTDELRCDAQFTCKADDTLSSWCVADTVQSEGDFCTSDAHCAADAFCDTTATECKARGAGGATCNSARHCLSGRCNLDDRECEPLRAVDEQCSSHGNCADGLWCDPSYAASLCVVPLETGRAGDLCDDAGMPCGPGLECVSSICRAPLELGEFCVLSAECGDDAYCSDLGVCAARLTEGTDCDVTRECAEDLFCDGGECAARVARGDDCVYGVDSCELGTRCDPATGTCGDLAAVGEACGSSASCSEGLVCEAFAGRCQARLADGELCDESESCPVDQYCRPASNDPTCMEPRLAAQGEFCNGTSVRCTTDSYCNGVVCAAVTAVGEGCTTELECGESAYCGYDPDEGANVCRAYAGDADPCATLGSSALPLCNPKNLQCVYDTVEFEYRCVAKSGAGDACVFDEDCAGERYCDGGTCAALLNVGADCSDVGCRSELYCKSYLGLCDARSAAGDDCNRSGQCSAGASCVDRRTCEALADEGDRCDDDLPCGAGLYCDPEWGVCEPLTGPHPAGHQCLVDAECVSGHCENRICTGACQGVGRPGNPAGAAPPGTETPATDSPEGEAPASEVSAG